jgi:excisionase family DNA binding protein
MPKKIGSLTLYSVDDLHEQLGLSKMTIRTYLREGRIRGRKLGVSWYVTEEALREYFGESTDSSGSDETEEHEENRNTQEHFKYVVQGVNDLVSEKQECESIEDTIECLENQAIVSLFQVAKVNRESGEVVELVKARDFLNRHG